MKQVLGVLAVMGCAVLAGCGEQAPPNRAPAQMMVDAPRPAAAPASDALNNRVVARINGEAITMGQFLKPLIEAHGLPLLLNLVQLDLARQDAAEAHVTITPQDIQREQDLTLAKMFSDADKKEQDQADQAGQKGQTAAAQKLRDQIRKDRQTLLAQYLENQHYTRVEYDLVIEINAYLRNAAVRTLKGKITDDMVKQEFGVEYGQTAQVRIIMVSNMQEVERVQKLLKIGENFADVAKRLSRDGRTAPMGGQMPRFSRQTPGLPSEFKQLAFSLKPGQVSDPLNYGGNFYLIKLEQTFAPKAVKFDGVKDSLRKNIDAKLTDSVMTQLRGSLAEQAMRTLKIEDAQLAQQFNDLKAKREAAIRDRSKINQQWKKERASDATTQPAS